MPELEPDGVCELEGSGGTHEISAEEQRKRPERQGDDPRREMDGATGITEANRA